MAEAAVQQTRSRSSESAEGFTMIFGPDGAPLCEPLAEDSEGILYADVDLGMISIAKSAADPAGHYSRPDVTRLLLNRTPARRVEALEQAQQTVAPSTVLPQFPSPEVAAAAADDAAVPA